MKKLRPGDLVKFAEDIVISDTSSARWIPVGPCDLAVLVKYYTISDSTAKCYVLFQGMMCQFITWDDERAYIQQYA